MAGTIKGISVSIGGDTVDLKKSLKDVEQTSKSLQSELNAVNKHLKFDPSNSVLLAQKQEILEEKISATKESLKKLESVQDQVEEQAKKGDLGADKYRAYQRELETTKGVLNNLEKQLDETKNAQSDFGKKVNNTDLSEFKKEVEDVKSAASELKDTLKETATGIGAGLAVAGGGVATAIMSYNSVEDALNHLQAQTGMSADEMNKFKGAMENVYNGNYGEDMKDIANVMASVAQFTGETDPDKIQKITENVFALSDTFEYDYAESLRTIKMLMDQFGLSSDEAFNLIAQGTQKGLNKNGDLLDTINEYSVHYKQLGYTAEEFFNSLENGSSAGTFSVDKLGDAMKEFGIRSKDTATTTTEGFELIGLDADKMREAFAKGGDSAKEATEKTLDALFNLKDEVKQNQAGVDLFGTMWEDLGIDGVKALMNVTGEADKTKKSMQEIQDVKYDDLGNRLETLGRKTQTEVINPLIEKFFPVFEDGVDWAADHLDDLIPIIKALGKQVAIVWGVKKATEITKGVMNLISSYKTLATATKTATDGQKLLNSAQKANVISAVVTGVLTLINAINTYNETQWENSSLKEEIDKTNELTEEWNDLADEMTSKITEINDTELSLKADFESVNEMKERLQEIIKDGTIDENEEGDYKTIVDLLGEKVDGFKTNWNNLTLEKVDGKIVITDNIDEVNTNLDKLIEKWEITQAKLTLSSIYSNLQTELSKKNAEIKTLESTTDLEASKQEFVDYIFEKSNLSRAESKILADEIIEQKGDFNEAIRSLNKKLSKGTLDSKKYPNLFSDLQSGRTDNSNEASAIFGFNNFNNEATNRIKEYTDSIVENEEAIKKANSEYSTLKETSDGYYEALKTVNGGQKDYNQYIKLSTEYGLSHDAVLSLLKDDGIKTWDELVAKSKSSNEEVLNNGYSAINGVSQISDEFKKKQEENKSNTAKNVKESLDETEQAIEDKSSELEDTMSTTMTNTQDAAKIGGWSNVGANFIIKIINGIFSKNSEAKNAGKTSAEKVKTGGESVSLFSLGNNLVSGFISGITTGEAFKKIGSAAVSVAKEAYSTIKSWLGIASPSKETKKLGEFFSEGFAIGINEKAKIATAAAQDLAKSTQKSLNAVDVGDTMKTLNGLKGSQSTYFPAETNAKNITNAPIINVTVNGTQISNDYDIHKLADKVSAAIAEQITNDGMKWG